MQSQTINKIVMNRFDVILNLPLIRPLVRHRFMKFAIVGFSGTIINLAMLHINQEILFKGIDPFEFRLKISLAIAIFIATVNNYIWNRMWTWKGRRRGFFIQMGQYFLTCALAIAIQYIITIILSSFINYLIANMISIVLSAIFVYIINDLWTFMKKVTHHAVIDNGYGPHKTDSVENET